ncbi:hypothetical protein SAMN05421874_107117 [Nonomuraea maritima]|uniref:Uncharacterized protein n=1 Tax=Nonomuraea maritima TaxID=683260 RepID=A0A1G9BCR8_9ACTN|nr:hypothetical protein SAMN05421874_107117 [Nonomuraea maritima]
MAEVNGWVGVVPGHGSDESLRSISEGGREVLGLRMDISGREHFTYARDGRVLVAFEPHQPDERSGDDPHVLDHLMHGLRFELSIDDPGDLVEAPESISSTLALIGRVTGTDMAADWFLARHSSFRGRSCAGQVAVGVGGSEPIFTWSFCRAGGRP